VKVTAEDRLTHHLDIKIVGVKLWKAVEGDRYPHTKGKSARKMGSDHKGYAKEGQTYILKVQNKYDGSDREWRDKGRKDVLAEGAEQVRWVRLQMAWQREKGRTA